MQELIDKLMKDAGLSAEQASKALNTMVSHVKSILPPAFAGGLENMLSGNVPTADAMSASSEAPKAEASLRDKASDMADIAKEKLGEAKEKLTDLAGDAKEKFDAFTTKENLDKLKDQAEDTLEDLKDKAEDIAEDAINKLKGFFKKDD